MIRRAANLLGLMPTLMHEATHAAALWPWTEEFGYKIDLDGSTARWMVNLKDETPGVAVFLGHLAPTIVGVALAFTVAGLWWLGMINGGELPDSIGSWGKLSIALIAWGVYCTPSGSDIKGALGR